MRYEQPKIESKSDVRGIMTHSGGGWWKKPKKKPPTNGGYR